MNLLKRQITTNSTSIDSNKLSLPTKKTKPVQGIHNYIVFLYGRSGIGKTTFTSKFPKPLHLFYEPSGDALSLYARTPNSWDELLEYTTLLEQAKKDNSLNFETVVIDVVDICFNHCIEYICEPMGLDWPPQDYGKTWKKVQEEFRKIIYRLKAVLGVVLVSHAVEKNVIRLDGQSYDTVVPTLTGSGNSVLNRVCGLQAFYTLNSIGKRTLVIGTNNSSETKMRVQDHFHYTNGKPIMEIPMGKSADEAWINFQNAYNNKLIAPVEQAKRSDLSIKRTIK